MSQSNSDLKLLALDAEDLGVISALVQDAVMKVEDVGFAAKDHRFAMLINRFAWEQEHAGGKKSRSGVRKRSALRFDHVQDVTTSGINLNARDGVLELLSLQFEPGDAPAGRVVLAFAGGGTIELSVDCLEARINDLGAEWAARAKPLHKD